MRMRVLLGAVLALLSGLCVSCSGNITSEPTSPPEKTVPSAPAATEPAPAVAEPKPAPVEPAPAAAAPKPEAPADPAPAPVAAAKPPKPAAPKVVREWDMTSLPADKQEWKFPGLTPQQTAKGLWYGTESLKSGPVLENAAIEASTAGLIQIEAHATGTRKGLAPEAHRIAAIYLYWARTGDYEEGEWPFADARRIAFTQDKAQPGRWSAKLAGHKDWNEEISDLHIRYELAPRESGKGKGNGFSVFTKSIALLK
ncbi:MAG: hypothetical protein HYV27_20630 [Candidatus Hydrogenedentes bacterium]|nr:hypothetical protein [Candidatus Hydrogenedentota bacterium]